ncbi:MAG: alpha/beta fold hydrolase [Candidatus Thiodiazotropha endolucinida]|nr:alpha/beta fold hydrolase [Candidatus Thiodiazotropha sp. (ex Lucina pensylvanica)]MCG7862284.1 alpha/beta fold hydrolase [Candidatus Thiodiazotropha endolucinida]MCG7885075.1 alpha/beta fold hydrolase [Candidatus Thiodiazotropha taylori]MCG7890872.1 alpha/beta fold hydrolase [Candidatus Thiodiazotropha taylori]MCG7950700.1 alpha/beta fold hydrolase [Candidatus Thiodiazotropha taylori]
MKRLILSLLISLTSLSLQADVAVLVHGYLGSAYSWQHSGVNAALTSHGWQPAGIITPRGLLPAPVGSAENKFYTVELPSMGPVGLQADMLRNMLGLVTQQHPEEPIILVGHSAGGVIARMALVQGGVDTPKALITIASPHLGTVRAVEALDETDDPFPISVIKEFFTGEIYDVVRDSWAVLLDLVPERPGNLLFWLNRQPHPSIRYVSIVRTGPVGLGDELVPAFSQDMNNIQALNGRSETRLFSVSHALQPLDGRVLVELLAEL